MMETTPDTYLDGRNPAYDAVAKKTHRDEKHPLVDPQVLCEGIQRHGPARDQNALHHRYARSG